MRTQSQSVLALLACLVLGLVPRASANDIAKAKALNQQLLALYNAGKYQEAIPIAQQALQLREKAYGPEHQSTATYLANLADLYCRVDDHVKAAPLLARIVAIREKTLGPNHPDTIQSLNVLSQVYLNMGSFAKAVPLLRRVLEIREKDLGDNHADTIMAMNLLSAAYGGMGDFVSAIPLNQRLLELCEKLFGPDHPNTTVCLNNLAAFYLQMGDHAKSASLLERVLAQYEKAYSPDHPQVAETLNNLATVYNTICDYAKAEPLYQRALAIYEKTSGGDSNKVADILNNLAALYHGRGDYAKAGPLFQRNLEIREKAYPPDHPAIAHCLNTMTAFYDAVGDYATVEKLSRRELAIYEKALGFEHPNTVNALGGLGLNNIALGRPAEATKLALRKAELEEKLLANVLSFAPEEQRAAYLDRERPYDLLASLDQASVLAQTVLRWKGVVLDSLIEDRLVAAASDDPALREAFAQLTKTKQQLMRLLLEVPNEVSEQARQNREGEIEKLKRKVAKLESDMARQVAALGRTRRALTVTVPQVQAALSGEQALIEMVRYKHWFVGGKSEARYGAVVIGHEGEPQWVMLGKADEIEKTLKLYQQAVRNPAGGDAALAALQQELCRQLWVPIEKALPAGTRTVILSPDGELNFLSFSTLLSADNHFLCEKYSFRYVASGRDLLREFQIAPNQVMCICANPDFEAAPGLPSAGDGRASAAKEGVGIRSAEMRDFSGVSLPPLPGTQKEGTVLAAQLKQAGLETALFVGPQATEGLLRQLNSPVILHVATHGFFLADAEAAQSTNANLRGMSVVPVGGDNAKGASGGGGSRPVTLKSPMHRSGLALAGAQRTVQAWGRGETPPTDDDGIVTAEDVGSLKLEGTWLVVLSACETGVGQARAGEGVLGLRRGFVQSGAQNLLMTLWPVADEETVKVMADFYTALQQTGNAPQALERVQRDWLMKLRQEKGIWYAVNRAGPFIVSSYGPMK